MKAFWQIVSKEQQDAMAALRPSIVKELVNTGWQERCEGVEETNCGLSAIAPGAFFKLTDENAQDHSCLFPVSTRLKDYEIECSPYLLSVNGKTTAEWEVKIRPVKS